MDVPPADVALVQQHSAVEASHMATVKGTVLGAAAADGTRGRSTAATAAGAEVLV